MIPAAVANHLWHSTLFTAVAWLLTLALKKNRASIRYWIWLIASLKFFLPFSLLVGLGSHLGWLRTPAVAQPELTVMEDVGQPFAAPEIPVSTPDGLLKPPSSDSYFSPWLIAAGWFVGFAAVVLYGVVRWRRLAALLGKTRPLQEGREVQALRRVQIRRGAMKPVELASSTSAIEPGVRGIIRPVLLLPFGIADRLDDEQLESILAHELSHIRRRDNLAAAIHMAVETIFWFHPLVWWIGSRLVDERERSCDEEVLQSGITPEAYAGAILKVCEFYLASPLTLVSGVTGSNLENRIESIMTNRVSFKLSSAKKVLVAAFGIGLLGIPMLFGATLAPRVTAPPSIALSTSQVKTPQLSFEVASIKPNNSGLDSSSMPPPVGGRFSATNVSLGQLVRLAYEVQDFQIDGKPGWFDTAKYDVEAKAEGNAGVEQLRAMVRSLLADRFKLTFHRGSKEVPVLALIVSRNGSKLRLHEGNCVAPPAGVCGTFRASPGEINGDQVSMDQFATRLSRSLGRTIINKTQLKEAYDLVLKWAADELNSADEKNASIFSAVQEQLGLRLESQKAPLDTIVIDRAEKPAENLDAGNAGNRWDPIKVNQTLSLIAATTLKSYMAPEEQGETSLSAAVGIHGAPLTFEVASIKPNTSGRRFFSLDCHGTDSYGTHAAPLGRCVLSASTVQVIGFAYDIPFSIDMDQVITGGPSWLGSERYDIDAKAVQPATERELKRMLQVLLAERFKLSFHRVSKEAPAYALVVGKNGPRLVEPKSGEAPFIKVGGGGRIDAQNETMAALAGALKMVLNGPVADQTGLTAAYDFTLTWSPDESQFGGHGFAKDPLGSLLVTALQEQLGLRLESRKGQGDILVIDHVERPSAN